MTNEGNKIMSGNISQVIKTEDVFAQKPRCRMAIMRSLNLEWQDMDVIAFHSGELRNLVLHFLHALSKEGKVERKAIVISELGFVRRHLFYRWTQKGHEDFVKVQQEMYRQRFAKKNFKRLAKGTFNGNEGHTLQKKSGINCTNSMRS